jgi:hypothetical protein
MGAWREAVEGQDRAYGKSTLGDAAFCIAYTVALMPHRVGPVLAAAAILRRHYQGDGIYDPGRQEPLAEVDGDERLWRALRIVAAYGSQSRIYAWRADQKGLALRDAEAELREWWKGQQA